MKDYLSIDIGGTFIKYAIITQSGNILKKEKVKTPTDIDHFLQTMETIIHTELATIRAVAISCPGKIDSKVGTVYFGGALQFLHGFPLKEFVENQFRLPCAVINDGKAAALAELWLGQLKETTYSAALTLGTGIGGGIIVNGEILEGAHFQAGELSFMVAHFNDTGIQSVSAMGGSAVNFIREAAKKLDLTNLLDGKTVFNELEKGNPDIYPLFIAFAREIATVLINIQVVVDVEKIAIGGGISAQPIVLNEIKKQYYLLRDSLPAIYQMLSDTEIVACEFRNESGLLGALYHLLVQIETNN